MFANPQGNELIPLTNDQYPLPEHVEDVLRRQSRRGGVLLNSVELTGFVHLPGSVVRSPALERQVTKTKAAPAIVRQARGSLLGDNVHAGESTPARLSAEQRVRHCHVIGASGTGKSTLLFNLIRQDIENGEGVAVLDPHGDLIDRVLGVVPERRIADVILFDPSDAQYSIGFNVLSAHSDLEKTLLASDLVSVFRRLSASWGDQMGSVLQNAILAFLESSRGGTLADLRRFLLEPAYRQAFLQTVHDPEVLYYWHHAFPQLTGNKSIGPVLTRLETFLAPKPIRCMVSQTANRLDFAGIMDSGKILLAKLPQGLLGRENSYLLGTLLVAKLQQTAMSRQAQAAALRRNYWIYVDEFHQFITPSMAEIVSGARKYRVGLTLAHQELRQLQQDAEVGSAVLSNSYTRIVFRVGDDDARKLADGFASFEARDLQNLPIGQAVCRVERSDFDFNLSVPPPEEPAPAEADARRQRVLTVSREKYGTPRAEVEALLAKQADAPARAELVSPIRPTQTVAPKPPVLPQPSEVPKPTDSGKEQGAERREPPRDLGRGGAQHQAIQKRIKQAAEGLGFRSVIEKPVLDGQGSVDLWLERAGETIACEISISTTIDHEVGNVAKCLKAGAQRVAVICLDQERLRKIEAAVSGSLGADLAARVGYFQPDQFIARLKALPPPAAPPAETQHGGYKVKRSAPKLSPEEQKQKEALAVRLLAEAMRAK